MFIGYNLGTRVTQFVPPAYQTFSLSSLLLNPTVYCHVSFWMSLSHLNIQKAKLFIFFFFTLILIRVPVDATIHPGIHASQNPHFRLTVSISSHPPSLHLYQIKFHYVVYLLYIFGVYSNFPISSTTSLVQATMFFSLVMVAAC